MQNQRRESEIVAESGRLGAVNVATIMAGGATDMILGGNDDFMARLKLREMLVRRTVFQDIIEGQAPGLTKDAERFLVLSNIDHRSWKEHLQALKLVQQAVGLVGCAQRDPLTEYKLEGYNLFLRGDGTDKKKCYIFHIPGVY
ncbi:hypothetical protein CerSpe_271920 [Prunus speciosa]